MKSAYRLLTALACVLLAGCGSTNADIKDTLGLNHEAPDEFRVLPRPPLSVPPDFNMRPPGTEKEYVSGQPAENKAHDTVLGTPGASSKPLADTAVVPVTSGDLSNARVATGTDSQLLANAGATKADPNIRQKLLDDKFNGARAKDSPYLIGGKKEGETEVDATKEAERLKQDKATNQPPSAGGDTPVVEQKDKGLWGSIF